MSNHTTLPAEWAPQSAVMLTWPHGDTDWAPILDDIEQVYLHIAAEITLREKLLIVCANDAHQSHIEQLLKNHHIDLLQCLLKQAPSNDSWARDHGPITVFSNGQPCLLDFQFNGWGGKHDADLDNHINQALTNSGVFKAPTLSIPMVLEGGSIESDGEGTLLTTRECLLTPTRNPTLNEKDVEQALHTHFGIQRVLWLDHGYLAGDDTDSHIDTLARFCAPRTIAHVVCEDPEDEHFSALCAVQQQLESFTTGDGQPYRLIPLPLPSPCYDEDKQRLPATYANFLIINGAVLVPTYDDPMDDVALDRLKPAFPNHPVIGIQCLTVIQQHGSLHCLTMQLPAGVI